MSNQSEFVPTKSSTLPLDMFGHTQSDVIDNYLEKLAENVLNYEFQIEALRVEN